MNLDHLKQRAAETLVTWREALKSGDQEKAERAEKAFTECHEAHNSAEDGERKAVQMAEFEEYYLQPQIENRVKSRTEQNSVERQQECMGAYITLGRFQSERAIDALVESGMQADQARQGVQNAKRAHNQAFIAYCIAPGDSEGTGTVAARTVLERHQVGPKEIHTLTIGDNTKGGFLVPEDRRDEVLADMPGARVMRELATIAVTTGDSVLWPSIQSATTEPTVRTSKLTTDQWGTEAGDATVETSDDLFGEIEIRIHPWRGKAVVASRKLLNAARNAEGIILRELFSSFTADEDKAYIKGSGANEPFGCLTDGGVTTVNSTNASALTFAGWLTFLYTLDAQYSQRATILLKRLTLKDIMQLENPTTNDYVWNPTLSPTEILGFPYRQSDFVDGVAAGKFVALLGDFKFGYVIAESDEFRILRLDQWKPPNIAFLPIAEVGGKIVRAAAFVRHKISV